MPRHGEGWTPLSVQRFVSVYPTSSDAARVETDIGEGFLKCLGNQTGPHALACELVGTALADWLGLPTLDFALIEITPEDDIPLGPGRPAQPGPAFITRAVEGFTWGGEAVTLQRLQNPDAIAGLVVFDTWLLNCDRHRPGPQHRQNRDNVFVRRHAGPPSRYELLAMDHTHCFTCGRDLTNRLARIDSVQEQTVYGLFPEFRDFVKREAVHEWTERLGGLTREQTVAIVEEVPAQWQVDHETRAAWVNLVVQRATFVAANVEEWLWPV